mgnify:CR=1 FL=1|jgi:hypothetical protein
MRIGLWFPVSSNALGVAFIITIIGMIIYAFYFNARKGSIKKLENTFNNGKNNDDSRVQNIRSILNFPENIEEYFQNRNIDFSTNTLSYFTDGSFSFALGSHKGLKVPKVFFRIDFSNNPIVHKLPIVGDQGDVIAELYLTAESTIFTEGNIRYYEVSWSDLRKISNATKFKFLIHESEIGLNREEADKMFKAIHFSLNIKSKDSHSLLARNE